MKPIYVLRVGYGAAVAAALLFSLNASAEPRAAAGSSLSGSWSGGGTVVIGGQPERARCRASYSGGGSTVVMNGTCATASGSVSQTARLRRVGANTYVGSFHNPQHGVSGSMRVTVNGRSQNVHLSAAGGSASLTLRH
ncbi:hypothetical protein Rvan_1930 [Rhodomicrobium vannielii ATCC 17100]|uniref:Uncharacterized protein n=1 Tax=Rhodomicrobium vannielii (strain ATCC 17100 / DSM 162 / LMG 4299 / NCIMB 10020 / ATH 3.1.1) TaxID=648757 RepID=E3I0S6_RHOVT|nr:hypothetical protein [Rhodomicrobium vannielii]ADP71166.1 hypothetical protein Rvan_1930 [Rhodomicrobium vannielii ATCC 17100]